MVLMTVSTLQFSFLIAVRSGDIASETETSTTQREIAKEVAEEHVEFSEVCYFRP